MSAFWPVINVCARCGRQTMRESGLCAECEEEGKVIGKRIDNDDIALINTPGAYGKFKGEWHGCTPNGLLAGLKNHTVTEHEDGTITVSPSILTRNHEGSWHGYLERGVWREC